MALYAEGTTVPAARSQQEISDTLTRYGATSLAIGFEPGRAVIAFVAHGRQVRMTIDLPTDPSVYARTAGGRVRAPADRARYLDAEIRRRWRALLLVLKAKLESAGSGITTFEQEFLPFVVLPNGRTVGEHVLPAIAEAYETGTVPALLPPRAIEGGAP